MHLNLLSLQLRRQFLVRRRIIQWSAVWSFAVLAAVLWSWLTAADSGHLAAELEALELRYGRVESMRAELRELQRQKAELQQREALALELSRRRPMLCLVGVVSQAAQQCEGNVSVAEITWNAAGADGDLQDAPPVLSLSGIGTNNVWVTQFATYLRQTDILRDVRLTSTQQTNVHSHTAHTYQLECVCY